MASKKHGNQNHGTTGEFAETATETVSNETASADGAAQSASASESGAATDESGTAATVVNSDTGEISGPGYEPEAAIAVEEVDMPKKIVAKDIVGRAGLKCTKKTVPVIDPNTNKPKEDSDGNIITEVIVSPPRDLYIVFGTADGTRSGTSQYGDWVSFTGEFEARRFSDGRVFKSNECILQKPADALLLNALRDIKKRDPGASVSFAFTIGVRTSQRWVDTNEGNSYEYTIRSQIGVTRADPLAHLRNTVRHALPAPAPKQLA